MKKLIIIGAGGHGKVCANIASDMKIWDTIAFVDDIYPKNKKILDFEIIGKLGLIKELSNEYDFFVAIGNNVIRAKILNELELQCKKISTLIHPNSYIGSNVIIQKGTSVHQNSVINTDSIIGKGCIINTGTIVEHENIIEDFVHLSPKVTCGGQVSIGSYSWIGIGSTLINNIKLSSNIFIGAGSLVVNDVSIQGKYFGSPIKKIE